MNGPLRAIVTGRFCFWGATLCRKMKGDQRSANSVTFHELGRELYLFFSCSCMRRIYSSEKRTAALLRMHHAADRCVIHLVNILFVARPQLW